MSLNKKRESEKKIDREKNRKTVTKREREIQREKEYL